jgi:ABC-type transporter Mla MlaB component
MKATYEREMLRITIFETATEQRMVLEGQLTKASVPELESAWDDIRKRHQNCECVIDLSETTCVDTSGKAALVAMICDGARLIAHGLYTEYLVQKLTDQAQETRCLSGNGARGTDVSSDNGLGKAVHVPLKKEKE